MKLSIRSLVVASTAGVGLAALAPVCSAQTVTLNLNAPFQFGQGGEFVATPSGFPAVPLSLTSDGNFQTFCVQTKVEFSPGSTYSVYFAPVGGSGTPQLTEAAAYLYDQFIRGVLPNYDFPDTFGQRQVDAGALQYALWNLEGQDTSGLVADPNPALTDFFVNLAIGNAVPGDFHGVSIMVMYTGDLDNPSFAQNQLVEFAPAPGAMALLGLGGLAAGRRRRYAVREQARRALRVPART